MGCGTSRLGPEDAALNCHSNNPLRRHSVVRPISDDNSPITIVTPPLLQNDDVFTFPVHDAKHKEADECGKEQVKVAPKDVKTKPDLPASMPPVLNPIAKIESRSDDPDDAFFKGPRSPSFREYCTYSSFPVPTSVVQYSHEEPDSSESSDTGNEDSIDCKSRPPYKEPQKKERVRGRKLRGVITKGRTASRKLPFPRHRSTHKL